jgi:hypothetical protein
MYSPTSYTQLLANCTTEILAADGSSAREHPMPIMFTFRAGEFVSHEGFNKRLALVNFLHILAGKKPKEEIIRWCDSKVNPAEFLDVFGAYGSRLYERDQLKTVAEILEADRNSQQAVILFLRQTDLDAIQPPSTVGLQFLARGNRLNGYAWVSAWDLIRWLPYDMVVFGGLVQVLASHLGMRSGVVFVFASSPYYCVDDVVCLRNIQTRSFEFVWLGTLRESREWSKDELRRRKSWKPLPYGVREVVNG